MAIVEDRFADQDLYQTYNSISGSETSDLSDTEDELKKTKTTSALSDGSDLNTSDSEFDLDFSPDPKPWKHLKPELQRSYLNVICILTLLMLSGSITAQVLWCPSGQF